MSKDPNLQRIRAIRGYRLTEALKDNKIRPAELLRRAAEQSTDYYFNMSAPALSQIMHGKRTLQYNEARIFADILGVEVDYLMGGNSTSMNRLLQYKKDADKYRMLLSRIGANVSTYIFEEDDSDCNNIKGYGVTYNLRKYDPKEGSNFDLMEVPTEAMESFYKDVCRYIEKRFEVLKDLYEEEV